MHRIVIHTHKHINECVYTISYIYTHTCTYKYIGSFDDTDTLFGETFQLNKGKDSVTGNRKDVLGKDSINTGMY